MVTWEITKSGAYIADGATTTFEFVFPVLETGDLRVSVDGSDVTIASATIDGNGGSVTLQTPPNNGALVVVYRQTERLQETDLVNGAAFYPEVIETSVDRLTLICQEFAEELARCVKVSIDSNASPEDIISTILAAKDIALDAAQIAGDANASCAAIHYSIQVIWAQITGDDSGAQGALDLLIASFLASGSIETAVAAAKADVNDFSVAAVAEAVEAMSEVKIEATDALEAAGLENASLAAQIAAAVGAEETLEAASAVYESAKQAAIDNLVAMGVSLEDAQATIAAQAVTVNASISAATDVVDGYKQAALDAVTDVLETKEDVDGTLTQVLQALQSALASEASANGYASSALQAALDAAASLAAATAAQIAAEGHAEYAGTLVSTSLVAHNADATAHSRHFQDTTMHITTVEVNGGDIVELYAGWYFVFPGEDETILNSPYDGFIGYIQVHYRLADQVTTKSFWAQPYGSAEFYVGQQVSTDQSIYWKRMAAAAEVSPVIEISEGNIAALSRGEYFILPSDDSSVSNLPYTGFLGNIKIMHRIGDEYGTKIFWAQPYGSTDFYTGHMNADYGIYWQRLANAKDIPETIWVTEYNEVVDEDWEYWTWYKKWSNGMVEQGGTTWITSENTSGNQESASVIVTFPTAFSTRTPQVMVAIDYRSSEATAFTDYSPIAHSTSLTSFTIKGQAAVYTWHATGY